MDALAAPLQDTDPGIWRRLLVPETITVPELHRVLQTAFGWENRHLFGIRYVDRLGQRRVIIGPDGAAEEMGDEPASGVVLFELLDAQQTGPSTLEYEYDFGDVWTHLVEVMGAGRAAHGCCSLHRRRQPGPSGGCRRDLRLCAPH